MTAGTVLSLVFAMHKAGGDAPSLNKACEVIDSGQFGPQVHRGTKEIRLAWRRMAPVAHLWAANAMLCYTDRPPAVELGREGLNAFLSWALVVREFGTTYSPPNQRRRRPLLDSSVCLRLPNRFEAASVQDISLPFPAWISEILATYRAPMRL
jgi:hypothetical protein